MEIYRVETCNFGRVIFWMREGICGFLKATNKRTQKIFHVSSGNDHQYPIFCGQNAIDTKDHSSYTSKAKKEVLINYIAVSVPREASV